MTYSDFGLVNTRAMFADALRRGYAVPAFNVYNMETLTAVLSAATATHSPVILAISESALEYMGGDVLMGMIAGSRLKRRSQVALHLDHGHSFAACEYAIKIGFSSVMIDASAMPFADNIKLSRRVANMAHKYDATVEAELGTLAGIEDENTRSQYSTYTDPDDAVKFVAATGVDSLAVAIGTSHGAYKRKSPNEKLRFDILAEIAERLPGFPLVLHGASCIPQKFINTINRFGGDISGALGISPSQLRRASKTNICKINIDSDSRLAFTAGVRRAMAGTPSNFNPREYLAAGTDAMRKNCIATITDIMRSGK